MDDAQAKFKGQSGSVKVLDIDIDSLLGFQQETVEGFTTIEWAEKLGISYNKMQDVLRVAVPKGLFSVQQIKRLAFNGKNRAVTVYRWIGEEKDSEEITFSKTIQM